MLRLRGTGDEPVVIELEPGAVVVMGRGSHGVGAGERTVSRRQCELRVPSEASAGGRHRGLLTLTVRATGRNPCFIEPVAGGGLVRVAGGDTSTMRPGHTLYLLRERELRFAFTLEATGAGNRLDSQPSFGSLPASVAAPDELESEDDDEKKEKGTGRRKPPPASRKRPRAIDDSMTPPRRRRRTAGSAVAERPPPPAALGGVRLLFDGISGRQEKLVAAGARLLGAEVCERGAGAVGGIGVVVVTTATTREVLERRIRPQGIGPSWEVHTVEWLTEAIRLRERPPADAFVVDGGD